MGKYIHHLNCDDKDCYGGLHKCWQYLTGGWPKYPSPEDAVIAAARRLIEQTHGGIPVAGKERWALECALQDYDAKKESE